MEPMGIEPIQAACKAASPPWFMRPLFIQCRVLSKRFQTFAPRIQDFQLSTSISATSGDRTHDLPVDNRILIPLSYGSVTLSFFQSSSLSTQHSALLQRRVKDSNLRRRLGRSALAPRRIQPLCQPSSAHDRCAIQRRVRDSNPQG